MQFTTLVVGDKEYKLRLPAKIAADVEQKIGQSLMALFGEGSIKEMPTVRVLVTVLHGSLQAYEHGIDMDDAYGIYDAYIEAGGSYAGMMKEIIEVLKVSGFFRGAPGGANKKGKA